MQLFILETDKNVNDKTGPIIPRRGGASGEVMSCDIDILGTLIKALFWLELTAFFYSVIAILGFVVAGRAGGACFWFGVAVVLFWNIDYVMDTT
jgi:hypothetical protein